MEVELRILNGGLVKTVDRATVVRDDEELIVLWLPRHPLIRLTRPGRAHSILHFFHEDGSFRGWYVNLEEPLRRTDRGFDCDDLYLDVWIEPPAEPRWLDEDEVEDALARGLLTEEQAAAARAEGERVLAEWPFPTGWESLGRVERELRHA